MDRDPQADRRAALLAIEAEIAPLQRVIPTAQDRVATVVTPMAPHLKNVTKIGITTHAERHLQGGLCVTGETQFL